VSLVSSPSMPGTSGTGLFAGGRLSCVNQGTDKMLHTGSAVPNLNNTFLHFGLDFDDHLVALRKAVSGVPWRFSCPVRLQNRRLGASDALCDTTLPRPLVLAVEELIKGHSNFQVTSCVNSKAVRKLMRQAKDGDSKLDLPPCSFPYNVS